MRGAFGLLIWVCQLGVWTAVLSLALLGSSPMPLVYAAELTPEVTPSPSVLGQANRSFLQGVQAFNRSEFSTALEFFSAALPLYQQVGPETQQRQGQTLFNLAVTARILGRYDQAQAAAEEALAIATTLPNDLLRAQSLNELGVIAYSRGQFEAAIAHYQESLALSETLQETAPDATRQLSVLIWDNLGVVYRRQGVYLQALAAHQRALSLYQEGDDGGTLARILSNIGLVYDRQGFYPQALEYNQHALTIAQDAGNRFMESRILNSLGVIYANLADYPQAQDYYTRGLSLSQSLGNQAEAGRILNNLGDLAFNQGDYQRATEFHTQALTLRQEIGDRIGEGESLNNLGVVHLFRGEYDQAQGYFQQALQISRDLGNRPGESNTLSNLGNLESRRGNYAQALTYFESALDFDEAMGDRASQSNNLNSVGGLYYLLGQPDRALTYYQQALAIQQTIGNRVGESSTLSNIGQLYSQAGQPSEALGYYQRALSIRQEIDDRVGVANTLGNIGLTYNQLGQNAEALATFEQVLTIRQETGDRVGEAGALNNIGLLQMQQGQRDAALNAYQQALAIFQEVGERAGERLALSNLGSLLAQQNQTELAILFYKRSVNVSEAIRQDLITLPTELQTSYTETVADTYRQLADLLLQQDRVLEAQQVLDLLKVQELEDYLQDVRGTAQTAQGVEYWQPEQRILELYDRAIAQGQELARLRTIPAAERTQQQRDRLQELVTTQQALVLSFDDFLARPEVTEAVSQLNRTTRRQNLDLEQLTALQDNLRNLNQNAVLLYPLILEDRLELVLTTPYAPPIRRTVAVSRAQFNATLLAMRQALTNRRSTRTQITASAQQLYQWLIAPIESDLQQAQAQTILYAPDGPLRYIPLGTLHDGEQWLIQRYRINYITAASLTDFDTAPQTDLRVLAGAFTQGQVDVQVGTRQFTFAGLPFAGVEVETIAAAIPDTTELRDQDFSPEKTIPQMNDYSVVHFATHAEFTPGDPQASFILFGNGERATLRDISTWSLPDVDLVVLSACRTAVGGELGNGEEILGFGYQIQRTGARAAIASLWYVDDGGTQMLMNAFYAALRRGMTKAEALRQAQIALITGDYTTLGITLSPEQSNALDRPYYWAPFILIGNGL